MGPAFSTNAAVCSAQDFHQSDFALHRARFVVARLLQLVADGRVKESAMYGKMGINGDFERHARADNCT